MAAKHFRTITLTSGHAMLVDECDYALARSRSWQPQPGKGTLYASGTMAAGGRAVKIYLHRLILDARPGQRVDHLNGNGLDNRRCNLRLCTNAENMRNMRRRKATSSRYKGVSWFKRHQLWRAYIVVDGRQIHLGYHENEADAARAYNRVARERFGSFAFLNDVPD